jgi:hypothetical protein
LRPGNTTQTDRLGSTREPRQNINLYHPGERRGKLDARRSSDHDQRSTLAGAGRDFTYLNGFDTGGSQAFEKGARVARRDGNEQAA